MCLGNLRTRAPILWALSNNAAPKHPCFPVRHVPAIRALTCGMSVLCVQHWVWWEPERQHIATGGAQCARSRLQPSYRTNNGKWRVLVSGPAHICSAVPVAPDSKCAERDDNFTFEIHYIGRSVSFAAVQREVDGHTLSNEQPCCGGPWTCLCEVSGCAGEGKGSLGVHTEDTTIILVACLGASVSRCNMYSQRNNAHAR